MRTPPLGRSSGDAGRLAGLERHVGQRPPAGQHAPLGRAPVGVGPRPEAVRGARPDAAVDDHLHVAALRRSAIRAGGRRTPRAPAGTMIVLTSGLACWSAIRFLLDCWAAGLGVRPAYGESCGTAPPVCGKSTAARARPKRRAPDLPLSARTTAPEMRGRGAGAHDPGRSRRFLFVHADHAYHSHHADLARSRPSRAVLRRRATRGAVLMSAGRRLVAIYNPTSGGGHFRRDVPLIVESLRGAGLRGRRGADRAGSGPRHASSPPRPSRPAPTSCARSAATAP